jgi:hypothetical protein
LSRLSRASESPEGIGSLWQLQSNNIWPLRGRSVRLGQCFSPIGPVSLLIVIDAHGDLVTRFEPVRFYRGRDQVVFAAFQRDHIVDDINGVNFAGDFGRSPRHARGHIQAKDGELTLTGSEDALAAAVAYGPKLAEGGVHAFTLASPRERLLNYKYMILFT